MAKSERLGKSALYDCILVGSGLLGLMAAKLLSRQGLSVAVLEKRPFAGGHFRGLKHQQSELRASFDFLPDSEQTRELVGKLGRELGIDIELSPANLAPLTFQDGGLKEFLGFGDKAPESADFLSQLNASHVLLSTPPTAQVIDQLIQSTEFEIFLQSEVTEIERLESDVFQVKVNDSQMVLAKQVIFTPSPRHLEPLLKGLTMAAKFRQRLARAKSWSALYLHFHHAQQISDNQALHFLMGSGEETHPCVGKFWGDQSLWLCLISPELAEDMDHVSGLMKYMKRQIKRAYPQALDGLRAEVIRLLPDCYGDLQQNLSGQQCPDIPGLLLLNSQLEGRLDWLAGCAGLFALEGAPTSLPKEVPEKRLEAPEISL